MRAIAKGREPTRLTTHRATPHSDYDNFDSDGKQELRESLVQEQVGFCCYCMARLEAKWDTMKIEHWQCQENYPDRQLDYANLLAACLGGEGQPGEKQHCDTRKGKRDLKFSPAVPSHRIEQRIRFEADGTIASSDSDFDAQLNEVLGLNLKYLKNRRRGILIGLLEWWSQYRSTHHRRSPRSILERRRDDWKSRQGQLQPCAQVAIWWLGQKLSEAAA